MKLKKTFIALFITCLLSNQTTLVQAESNYPLISERSQENIQNNYVEEISGSIFWQMSEEQQNFWQEHIPVVKNNLKYYFGGYFLLLVGIAVLKRRNDNFSI